MKRVTLALLLLAVSLPSAAAARRPNLFNESYRQGVRWMQQKQWQRADAAFTEALSVRESVEVRKLIRTCRFNGYMQLGEAAAKRQNFPDAVEQYRKALDLDAASTAATLGLRTAQYEIYYRAGVRALSAHDYESARQAFRRCLEVRPGDTPSAMQLDRVDAESAALVRAKQRWQTVEQCLQAEDSACLEQQAGSLTPAAGAANAALLPALKAFAQGDLPGARQAARTSGAPGAGHLESLLRSQARRRFAQRWSGWAAALYCVTLLASLYAGLHGVRSRQLA